MGCEIDVRFLVVKWLESNDSSKDFIWLVSIDFTEPKLPSSLFFIFYFILFFAIRVVYVFLD